MKKYRLTLPCAFPDLEGADASVHQAGEVVELDDKTAARYAHALIAVEE